jgi:uncharacterized protein (DUF488 family)
MPQTIEILTIGHSTRPIDEFLHILRAHGVTRLIDVRTVPRSRTNPQFNRDTLPPSLESSGISYEHMPGLGGLRRPAKDSVNLGWENASFRGYADYMQTEEFAGNILELIERAAHDRIAIMCAEAVPWRCHRSLVADALIVRGIPVRHIMTGKDAKPHTLTKFAHVDGDRVTYPSIP